MISLQFIESGDISIVGEYTTFKQSLKIGKSLDCDIIINDSLMNDFHFLLDLTENSLSVTPHESVEYYHLNSKRTKNHKSLKIGDVISSGSTKFKILKFLYTKNKRYEDILEENMRKVFEEDKNLLKLLKESHTRESK